MSLVKFAMHYAVPCYSPSGAEAHPGRMYRGAAASPPSDLLTTRLATSAAP